MPIMDPHITNAAAPAANRRWWGARHAQPPLSFQVNHCARPGLVFFGCQLGPQYAPPSTPTAPAFKEALPENFNAEHGWKPAQPYRGLFQFVLTDRYSGKVEDAVVIASCHPGRSVARLVKVILLLEIKALVRSFTEPAILPPTAWPRAGWLNSRIRMAMMAKIGQRTRIAECRALPILESLWNLSTSIHFNWSR